MKTDVYFTKKEHYQMIAYENAKRQNVFLQLDKCDFAPQIINVTICDKDNYEIQNTLEKYFEYSILKKEKIEIGVKIPHIWKPLLENARNELDFKIEDLCRSKRDLGILIQKFQEILLYVEPSPEGLKTYSHKIRELLILACTELESFFKFYNLGNNEKTPDYVKILSLVDLGKHHLSLVGYTNPYECSPFKNWDEQSPTKSLPWYDAYNQVKHHKDSSFPLATLENCINAIAANIIMFAIRYSPAMLYNENDVCSNLVRNSLDFRIEETQDFYIPVFEGKTTYTGAYSYSISFPNGTKIKNVCDQIIFVPFIER